jgi:hypothetical protein
MSTHIITFCSDVTKYRHRLRDHYYNDICLKSKIRTNTRKGVLNPNPPSEPTEFWIAPHKIHVLYNGNESFCCSKVPNHVALGVQDENGDTLVPSVVDAVNVNPIEGNINPVLETWGIGEVCGPNCIYEALTDAQKEKLREFYPEFVETDEGITQRGLIPEICV